jgi:adenosine deaminase
VARRKNETDTADQAAPKNTAAQNETLAENPDAEVLSGQLLEDFVQRIPKTELHIHLDGSLRVETLHKLLKEIPAKSRKPQEEMIQNTYGKSIDLSKCSVDALAEIVKVGDRVRNLEEYLIPFAITGLVMQEEDNIFRITKELVLDNAAQNVRYLEVRFAPLLHLQGNLQLPQVIETVLRGLRAGEQEASTAIEARLIICGMRQDVEGTKIAAEMACAYKGEGVVAFDIAGPEDGFPPRIHHDAFNIIRSHMLPVTVHAGEGYGPRSIRQALFHANARRLGHGTRVYQDGDLFRYIVNQRIPLECCLSSNVHTKTVHAYGSHPLRSFLKRGVRVTLNTDNTLISDTTINQEYIKAATHLRLNKDELKQMALNGFNSTFDDYEAADVLRETMRHALRKIH